MSRFHSLRRRAADGLMLLGAGALAPLGFAPIDWWPLTLLSMTLFLALIHRSSRPALCGWLYGVGFYAVGVSWVFVSIHQFGQAPIWLAGLLTGLFVAGIALFFALPALLLQRLRLTHSLPILLGFPTIWVLGEWFRSWFLTGFPWLLSGYVSLDTWFAAWAPITGIYGVSFILALMSAALWLLVAGPRRPQRLLGASIMVAVTLTSLGLSTFHWVQPGNEQLSITVIQGNINQNLKWLPAQRERILNSYIAPTLKAQSSDLVLWPETAVPEIFDRARPRLERLAEQLAARGSGLITGVASRERTPDGWRYHNSIVGLGTASGIYHKQRLVPFGEYVPLEEQLRGLIQFFDLPMSNFSLGQAAQAPLRSGTYALAPFICYEIVYPELVRSAALYSDFLLTVSNDAWFGDSLAPHQHLQMARMRALENGRQLVRGTNNGITALINQQGEVVQQIPQFEATVLQSALTAVSGTTPYTRVGSLPVLLLCGVIACLLIALRLQDRRHAKRPQKTGP